MLFRTDYDFKVNVKGFEVNALINNGNVVDASITLVFWRYVYSLSRLMWKNQIGKVFRIVENKLKGELSDTILVEAFNFELKNR